MFETCFWKDFKFSDCLTHKDVSSENILAGGQRKNLSILIFTCRSKYWKKEILHLRRWG